MSFKWEPGAFVVPDFGTSGISSRPELFALPRPFAVHRFVLTWGEGELRPLPSPEVKRQQGTKTSQWKPMSAMTRNFKSHKFNRIGSTKRLKQAELVANTLRNERGCVFTLGSHSGCFANRYSATKPPFHLFLFFFFLFFPLLLSLS